MRDQSPKTQCLADALGRCCEILGYRHPNPAFRSASSLIGGPLDPVIGVLMGQFTALSSELVFEKKTTFAISTTVRACVKFEGDSPQVEVRVLWGSGSGDSLTESIGIAVQHLELCHKAARVEAVLRAMAVKMTVDELKQASLDCFEEQKELREDIRALMNAK